MLQNIWYLPENASFIQDRFTNHQSKGDKIYILCDENTREYCLPGLLNQIPCLETSGFITIQSGEINKTLDSCIKIWNQLDLLLADRKSVMINLGGGVICDMGGFAAAVYKRGIRFYQVPTTLLAQVDAAFGGKTGIDFNHYKNHLGLFTHPEGIIVNPDFLGSLDSSQILSGYAEIFKTALVNDAYLLDILLKTNHPVINFDQKIISRTITNKIQITEEDFSEKGKRKILNFGHTIGHAIESLTMMQDRPVLHGEAIAAGMVCESWISWKMGLIDLDFLQEINQYILLIFKKIPLELSDIPHLLELMLKDKKNQAERVNITLLSGRGASIINQFIDKEIQEEALKFYIRQVG